MYDNICQQIILSEIMKKFSVIIFIWIIVIMMQMEGKCLFLIIIMINISKLLSNLPYVRFQGNVEKETA